MPRSYLSREELRRMRKNSVIYSGARRLQRYTSQLLMFLIVLFGNLPNIKAQSRAVTIDLNLSDRIQSFEIDKIISLSQGGQSAGPMWDNRIAEVHALHPRLIRIFIIEPANLMPAPGK